MIALNLKRGNSNKDDDGSLVCEHVYRQVEDTFDSDFRGQTVYLVAVH